MENHTVIEKELGAEASAKLVVIDKQKVRMDVAYKGSQATAGMYVEVDVLDIIQALVDSTETNLDNQAFGVIKGLIQA